MAIPSNQVVQTRGRSTAKVLKGASGHAREVHRTIDLSAVESILAREVDPVPTQLLDRIRNLSNEQDIKLEAGRIWLVRKSEIDRTLGRLETAAAKLAQEIAALKQLPQGPQHFDGWVREHLQILQYPDAFLRDALTGLAHFRERYYRDAVPKDDWHSFILQVSHAFEEFDLPVATQTGSVFVRLLEELDRQFPALAFPPSTNPGTGRRDYVRAALGRTT